METTLGGDRLGSGNKQKVELHNYHMSSFNLEQDWKSSMAPGILYPFLKLVGTNHGTFDIDLDHFIRTIPTNAPLFGSFKFQADIFCVPIRLYQGILHNNPIDIGLKMDQVYLPKINLMHKDNKETGMVEGTNKYTRQISNSSLLKYLGLSGIATAKGNSGVEFIHRKFNAVPILAYYDIFKNYYANKQEENAYVITPGDIEEKTDGEATLEYRLGGGGKWNELNIYNTQEVTPPFNVYYTGNFYLRINYKNVENPKDQIEINFMGGSTNGETTDTINGLINENLTTIEAEYENSIILKFTLQQRTNLIIDGISEQETTANIAILTIQQNEIPRIAADIKLTSFPLKNIDVMRQQLLSLNELGDEYVIDALSQTHTPFLPYATLVDVDGSTGVSYNAFKQNGLVVKTYQSDLFNNWLNSDTIDMITSMTKMDTTNGFTMDDLNFMEKAYNVLNRIALTGGTYEDWQEAVYGEGAIRKAETPMYMGGMSAEIMFEEVIASTESGEGDNYQALGALGGKGTAVNKKGGNNIHIKCEEPCYIIGIASITPRISYSQGNDWDLTDLDTLNDLHKPGFDGIGFQDLMIEQMAWWNSEFIPQGGGIIRRYSAGKQIAWINYQTAVDKVYGDFADKKAIMVLNRNYEMPDTDEGSSEFSHEVSDLTTYIDPSKYNYAFAYAGLDANNFWVQLHSKIIARRKMAAQQIPNL